MDKITQILENVVRCKHFEAGVHVKNSIKNSYQDGLGRTTQTLDHVVVVHILIWDKRKSQINKYSDKSVCSYIEPCHMPLKYRRGQSKRVTSSGPHILIKLGKLLPGSKSTIMLATWFLYMGTTTSWLHYVPCGGTDSVVCPYSTDLPSNSLATSATTTWE